MKDIDESILDTIPISIYAKFLSEGGLKITGKGQILLVDKITKHFTKDIL